MLSVRLVSRRSEDPVLEGDCDRARRWPTVEANEWLEDERWDSSSSTWPNQLGAVKLERATERVSSVEAIEY